MLKTFAYHGVTVGDLDRSVAYYRDILDMTVERTYEVAGAYLEEATGLPGAHTKVALLRFTDTFGDHLLKLIQYLAPEGKKTFEARVCDVGANHIDVCTPDVRGLYEALLARGARFISPPVVPMPERPERTFTYLLDPDNIIIELHLDTPHHAISVSDRERALAFYRGVLGMKLWRTNEIKGPGISEGAGLAGAHKTSTHLILDSVEFVELLHYMSPQSKTESNLRLCDVGCAYVAFGVDDVQQSYQELRDRGVTFISPPVREKAGDQDVAIVYLRDVDGYAIELRPASAPV